MLPTDGLNGDLLKDPTTCPPGDGSETRSALVPIASRSNGQLAHASSQAALATFPDAPALLKALRRRWPSALVAALACAAGITFAVAQLLPQPKHIARSLLQISNVTPKIFFPTGDNQPSPFDRYQRTQIVLVKSRLVLGAALRQPAVARLESIKSKADPALWLEKTIKADFALGPEILSISLSGDDPEELVTIVNAVAKAYTDEIVDKDHHAQQARLKELKKINTEYSAKVQAKQQALREAALAAGSRDSKNLIWKQQLTMQQLAQARKELTDVQSDLRKLRVRRDDQRLKDQLTASAAVLYAHPIAGLPVSLVLAGLFQNQRSLAFLQDRADGSDALDAAAVDRYLKEQPGYQKALQRVADVQGRIKSYRRARVPGSYSLTLKALEEELAEAQAEVASQRSEAQGELAAKRKESAKANSAHLWREYNSLEQLERALQDDVTRLAKESSFMNESTIKVEEIRESISHEEEVMRKIAAEVDALEVEQRAPSRVTRLEQAVLYPGQVGRKELIIIAGAGVSAFGLVLFLFGWMEFRCHRIGSSGEVVQSLGIRVVGTVPELSSSNVQSRVHDLTSTSLDATRTVILHAAEKHKLKVVLITSALAGEGKTSSAAHLGASLSRAGRRTLLIDADLRKPNLNRLFDVPRSPGLSELLRGQNTIDEVIRPTAVSGLALITAGQGNDEAIHALASEGVSEIFGQLRKQFDFVVIDCAPILPVPDALTLARHADAAILTVLRDVSRLPTVYEAYQRLSSVDLHVLGAVLNGARDCVYYPYFSPVEV
jgi:capsular exopolysaccharide synthesis family protein